MVQGTTINCAIRGFGKKEVQNGLNQAKGLGWFHPGSHLMFSLSGRFIFELFK